MQHLSLMTYDLETYSQRTDISEKEKIIMNIGIGFFNILSQTPTYKACLCVKPFTEEDCNELSDRIAYCYPGNDTLDDYARSHGIDEESVKKIRSNLPVPVKSAKYIRYIVFGEMDAGNYDDYTDYVIFSDERSMLMQFMRTILQKKPDYFGGFNNYGYDDPYVWKRLGLYNLQSTFLTQLFSIYDTRIVINDEVRDHPLLTRSALPRFEKFQIKIDSMAYPNNETFKGNSIVSVDVYKILLASNAKLYTQLGKGTLKSMLQTNTVKNPYNGSELDKYDLSYVDMFRNWDANTKIYEINHYCMYDAVTCGVLLIKTAQIIDKIEMSTLTDTSVSDSYYRAVTSRILAITNEYAHKLGFAMMDHPIDSRPEKEKKKNGSDDSD
jgi:DNA polymerase elongation subunit (family B)